MKALSEQQIRVAVEWWKQTILDHRKTAFHPMTDDQIDRFGEKLDQIIRTEQFAEYPRLGSEYGPWGALKDALDDPAIRSSNFPWHTIMWFDDGGVQVGYGPRRQKVL